MILKEYECMAHGYFDGYEPKCPNGCSGENMIQRVFLTAPSIQTVGYKNINGTFESLAQEHGLSDMNNRSGEGMRMADAGTHKRLRQTMEMIAPNGTDVNQYFGDVKSKFQTTGTARPIGEAVDPRADTRPLNGSIYRDQNTGLVSVGEGIGLSNPRARLEAPSFDGSKSGLPQ